MEGFLLGVGFGFGVGFAFGDFGVCGDPMVCVGVGALAAGVLTGVETATPLSTVFFLTDGDAMDGLACEGGTAWACTVRGLACAA